MLLRTQECLKFTVIDVIDNKANKFSGMDHINLKDEPHLAPWQPQRC